MNRRLTAKDHVHATMQTDAPDAGSQGPYRSTGVEKSALRASEGLLAGLSGREKARNRQVDRSDGRPGPDEGIDRRRVVPATLTGGRTMTQTWTLERDGGRDLRCIGELEDVACKLDA